MRTSSCHRLGSAGLLIGCLFSAACQQPIQASSRSAVGEADAPVPLAQALGAMADPQAAEGGSAAQSGQAVSGLRLCQGEPGSSACTGSSPAASAMDLGFIPASFSIDSIKLNTIKVSENGWSATAQLKPQVNGVPVWCLPGQMSIEVDAAGRTSTVLESTWCNWLLVGNVKVKLIFSTEEVFVEEGALAGFYEVHLKGTSNTAASGYLVARFE